MALWSAWGEYGQAVPQFRKNFIERAPQGSVQSAAGCISMSSASHPFSNFCYIHLSLAAHAQPDAQFRQLAEKYGNLHAGDTDGHVYKALAVLFGGAGAHHVLMRDPEPGQAPLTLQISQGSAQQ